MWEEIDAPGASARLSTSTVDAAGVVLQSPAALLGQARAVVSSTTLEEYTLARVINSEAGSRPPAELLVVGDCDLERAKGAGVSLLSHVTAGSDLYGKQGSRTPTGRKRPVATTRDPSVRHLRAARLLLGGRARGIAQGAAYYFNPRTQDAMWRTGSASYMSAEAVLERWTFNLDVKSERQVDGRREVTLEPRRAELGAGEKEPVFPCGVDPWRLIPFRRARDRAEQVRRYELAVRVIESGGRRRPPCDGDRGRGWLLVAAAGAFALGVTA